METGSQQLLSFLMNSLWQVTLLAAAAALCDRLLRGAPARYRHRLWVTALALCLCLPAMAGSSLLKDAFSVLHRQQSPATSQAAIVQEQFSRGDGRLSVADMAKPKPLTAWGRVKEAGGRISLNPKVAAALTAMYLLFALYRCLRLFWAWRKTRAMRRSARETILSEDLQAAIERCRNRIGTRRARVLRSDAVASPVTVGAFDPVILLPEHLLGESDADLLTSAIGHELVHVHRRDYLLNLLYELIYLPISFHPAAGLVKRRINQTRELGCDELVTEKLLDARAYARSLVRLAGESMPFNRATTTVSVGVADADILEERVMTILNKSKSTVQGKGWTLLAATLFLAVPALAAAPLALHVQVKPTGFNRAPQQPITDAPRGDVGEGQQNEDRERAEARLIKLKAEAELNERRRMEREARESSGASTQTSDPEQKTIRVNTPEGEKVFTLSQDPLLELKRQAEKRQRDVELKEVMEQAARESQDPEIIAHRKAEREMMAIRQAELARDAKISMQQAIQIASNQYPGTVLNSRLTRELGQACYVLSILSENGAGSTLTLVVMSATDGNVLKTEREER